MTPRPPKRLPRRYRAIWSALWDADERAASRAELCRRLGVSTHTVQRILVDGDVPDFSKPQSTRLVRSWTRALTRLARGLGEDPRRWVEGVGISWDEEIRRASEGAVRPLHPVRRPRAGVLSRIRSEAARGRPDPVEAGHVDLRPFVDPLPGGASFFAEYARRLVGAVEPSWGVRIRKGAAADLVEELGAPDAGLSFALGVFDTAHLRGRGLAILPLPGWRLAFSAVAATSRGGPLPRWEEIAFGGSDGRMRYLVQECDPAWPLVRSQWGVGSERILARRQAAPEALADDLRREADGRPGEAAVLVADEETCRRVLGELERRDGFGRTFEAARVPSPAEGRPRFRLGVAVSRDAGSWLELLEYAWREELFGSSRAATARLYAELLAAGSRAWTAGDDPPAELPTNVCPEHFPQADAEFQRILARHLISSLMAAGPGARSDEDWDALVRRARALVPREWRTTLDETAWAAKLETSSVPPVQNRPFRTYCQSCSGSLREYPSHSASYCRFCADEDGNLLPREEVHRIITHWMTLWQDGISEAEARQRATLYMSAMPAWS